MNLVQQMAFQREPVRYLLGGIETPLCQGRCCRERTAPVFITFGTRGALLLCADCRAWRLRTIPARIREIRRAA